MRRVFAHQLSTKIGMLRAAISHQVLSKRLGDRTEHFEMALAMRIKSARSREQRVNHGPMSCNTSTRCWLRLQLPSRACAAPVRYMITLRGTRSGTSRSPTLCRGSPRTLPSCEERRKL
jgi:hypothetical protein